MYGIVEKRRKISDGTEIDTFLREITDACVMEVEAGTTGYMGGDTGHGGRTYIRIQDTGGSDIKVKPLSEDYWDEGFELVLGGDAELRSIIKALKFVTKVLEDQAAEIYD